MKSVFYKVFSSIITTILLLSVFALALAVATFIEKEYGTELAKSIIYHSPLFLFLQLLLVVNLIVIVVKRHYLKKRRWAMLTIHFAFIIILSGAFVTYIYGEEGIMHIREGEVSDQIMMKDSKNNTVIQTLPFSIELRKFTLTRYPGSSSPSSYESELTLYVDGKQLNERVFMNNVLDVKGYRFFQASYDKDEKGTILSVSNDAVGRTITYTGYLFLLIGFIGCFISKESRFMYLSRLLKRTNTFFWTIVGVFLLISPSAQAQNNLSSSDMMEIVQRYNIPASHAELFGSLPMQSNSGRIMPVNTFSSEVLRKLHKSNTIGQLNSDQFLISLLVMPDVWVYIPFFSISNRELANYYNISGNHFSYAQVFDGNDAYVLEEKLDEVYSKMPSERTKFDKDLLKMDEQINIFHQLIEGKMLNIFPKADDPDDRWYAPGDDLSSFQGKDSMFVARIMDWYLEEVQVGLQGADWSKTDEIIGMINIYQQSKSTVSDIEPERMQAELRYNKLQIFHYCKIGYLILGGMLLVLSLLLLFFQQKWIKLIVWMLGILIFCVFLYQIYGMGMRWYIGGYAPWSNSYETMVYVGWATVLAGFIFSRRSILTLALASLFGGIILFVSGLNWMDPQINPLVPVLKSPWLMFHVAVIVASYGFFGISCMIGFTNMVLMTIYPKEKSKLFLKRIKELSVINEMSLLIGLALMTIGTFLGAVWANESWGRYWGWDPKETWALITVIVYTVVTHLHLLHKYYTLWLFNVLSVLAFSSVLMTFFGVNYLLSGMHSYGQNENINQILVYFYIGAFLIITLSVISYIFWKKSNQFQKI